MFRAKTLLVLGAGASAEVGLPVGEKLLANIVSLTDIRYDMGRMVRGDHHLSEALKATINEGGRVELYNLFIHAAWQLAASARQALSIDNVIDALEDQRIEVVGKLGIVRAIHQAEQESHFFKPPSDAPNELDLSNFKDTWYDRFTKLLCEGVRRSELETIFDNLEIINFNYDRCLEHYLPYSLANYYGVNLAETRALMPKLKMHRPYGVAGRLPWQEGPGSMVEFGGGRVDQTAEAALQIRTFTERIEEAEELARLKLAAANAERIVFLGFAFHRQNVELLETRAGGNAAILATALGVSRSDQGVIEEELATAFELDQPVGTHIELAPVTCHRLFQDYWRTLTAEPSPPWRELDILEARFGMGEHGRPTR